jgi:GGDEF domain-containing protein
VVLVREGALEATPDMFIERVRKNLDLFNEKTNRLYKISLSLGAVAYDPGHPLSIDTLLAQADNLMYQEKQQKKKIKNKP